MDNTRAKATICALALFTMGINGLQTSVPFSPKDPTVHKIKIAEGPKGQTIAVKYASSWPVWYVTHNGQSVTRVPDGSSDELGGGWVSPSSFEQLWLPMDLPPPTASAALGLVLKDGVPRYAFPTVETALATRDGGARHNRGLNSLPLAKTWLSFFNVVNADTLSLACYHRSMPTEENDEDDEQKQDEEWKAAFPRTDVKGALDLLFNAIANGPNELSEGFCFLITPLPSSDTQPAFLSKQAVIPGQCVRCLLSDLDTMPDDDDDMRAVCDILVHNVAPGGESSPTV
mmetsp:Transcript_925/g.1200  ORF Transcript_925/g.1200 Transcript_925/m.1200 type:complete len:287 (-) Transcript_925:370-1230(-)